MPAGDIARPETKFRLIRFTPPRVGLIDILRNEQFKGFGIMQHESGVAGFPFLTERSVVPPRAEKFTTRLWTIVMNGAACIEIEMRAPAVVGLARLFFGGKKLPELGKGLGEGLRGFKEGMKGITEDTTKPADTAHAVTPKPETPTEPIK